MVYNEKIIWIQCVTNTVNNIYSNNFSYNISGIIPQDSYDINVKLTLCFIACHVTYNYTANLIRILCDFVVGHNQISSNITTNNVGSYSNYIQLGVITNPNIDYYYSDCLELSGPTVMPEFRLFQSANILNFILTNESYITLTTSTSGLTPSFINLCLTFSYNI